jgi:hypothetical protein
MFVENQTADNGDIIMPPSFRFSAFWAFKRFSRGTRIFPGALLRDTAWISTGYGKFDLMVTIAVTISPAVA